MLDRRGFVSGAIFTTIGLALSPGQADAQKSPGDALKFLAKTEYPGDKYACVLVRLDLSPGERVPRHMHPGVESSYLALGGITLLVEGQPDLIVKVVGILARRHRGTRPGGLEDERERVYTL